MSNSHNSYPCSRYLVSAAIVLMLSACGGGSNSLSDTPSVLHADQKSASDSSTESSRIVNLVPRPGLPTRPAGTGTATKPTSTTTVTSTTTTTGTTHAPTSSTTGSATGSTSSTKPGSTGTRTTTLTTYKGVNLSGAEYNNSNPNARLGWDYMYPSNAEIDYYAAKGFTAIRLPFAGARLQPKNNTALNATELGYIQTVVTYCASKHITVILDPHDYGLKYDSISGNMLPLGMPAGLPASNYADFWSRLAQAFKGQSNVIFGLMNEPNEQTPVQWASVANAAIAAIRSSGANQLILIPGTDYTGAYDWVSGGNAAAWAHVSDPANNFAFEVHQYLDSDNSGTHATCVAGRGSTALVAATAWARSNGYHLFLGEVGWSQDPSCTNEGPAIMNYTTTNADVWIGWTYWAGGPWIPQSYIFMLDPANLANPVDKPQMQVLVDNLL